MLNRWIFVSLAFASQVSAMQLWKEPSQRLMRRALGGIPPSHVAHVRWNSSFSNSFIHPFKGRFVDVRPDGFVTIHQERYPKFKGLQHVMQTFRRTGPAFDIGDLLCYPTDSLQPSLLDPKPVETQLTSEPYEIISPESASYSPHFSCGKIDMSFPSNSKSDSFTASGSGAAIDRNLVVTAAHNFLPPSLLESRGGRIVPNDEKVKAETIYFLHLLTNNGQYQRGTHISPVTTHCFVHPKWEASFDPHYDIAFFFLSESMDITTEEAARLLKLRIVPPELIASVQVIGYPNGIPSMHESQGKHKQNGDDILHVIYHTANTLSGSSGSPIIYDQKGLVGVHTCGAQLGDTHNRGVRIRNDLMPFLEECIASHQKFLEDSEKFLIEQEERKKEEIRLRNEVLKAEGRAEGKAEGRAEGQKAIAMALIAKKMDDVFIQEITGLTLDQIKQWRRDGLNR